MHEGKHGILDGVESIDDVFGTEEDKPCTCEKKLPRCVCNDADDHDHAEGHDDAHGHSH